ncbi:MAG: RsmE family RNA methyltransferase [Planctomycetaceae bacterium]
MPHRFYAPQLADAATVRLTATEAHHLANVLRQQVGQQVMLFDGRGREAVAVIEAISGRTVQLRREELREEDRRPAVDVVLAAAVPKGERVRWLVEKATELGVHRFVPLMTQRSVVKPRDAKRKNLEQTGIAACKQCGRNTLMAIDPPTAWIEFLRAEFPPGRLLVAHPGGAACGPVIRRLAADANRSPVTLAIGPEGGWTEEELAGAQSVGAVTVHLGPTTLRIETAALALAAAVLIALAER